MNVQNDINGIPQGVGPDVPQVQRAAATQPASHAATHSSGQSSASAKTASDRTSLSSAASLASQAASVSDVRMEKVAAVQQALGNGTYSVSAEEVAGKLISYMQQK